MSIFDIDHIFVIFPPGGSGNFISGLLTQIDSQNLSALPISSTGSSHTVNNGKMNGGDSICFGTNPAENTIFSSVAEKEEFYLTKISKEYIEPKKIITWSHDYSNLVLYKKYFKNSKILSITCSSTNEQLVSIMMHVNKVFLGSESDMFISENVWNYLKTKLKINMHQKLQTFVKKDVDIDYIFDNRFNEFNDLIFYLSSVVLMNYAGATDLIKLLNEDFLNIQTHFPDIQNILTQHSDAILPYNYLIYKDLELLESSVSKIFKRTLTYNERKFIETEFINYVDKQNILLLLDPIFYFNKRKEKALEKIKELQE